MMTRIAKLVAVIGFAGLLAACNGVNRNDVGLAAGGVAGGVAGHALFGSTAGTVAGAVGGAFLGREVAKRTK